VIQFLSYEWSLPYIHDISARIPTTFCHSLIIQYPRISDGSGSKIFDPGRVGSGQSFMVWVWICKIFPKNNKFCNFFPSGQKNLFGSGQKVPGLKAGQPLIYCWSKVSSGRVRAHLYRQYLNKQFLIKAVNQSMSINIRAEWSKGLDWDVRSMVVSSILGHFNLDTLSSQILTF